MNRTKNLVLISLFVSLLCVAGLFLKITFIPPVPFTMLTFFAVLGSALLGPKKGSLGCLVYIFMGTVCYLPVFTKGGGLWYVLEPTFGYILALPFVCFLNGYLINKFKNRTYKIFLIFLMSEILILIIGALYAYIVFSFTTAVKDIWQFALTFCVMFIPSEILKALLAAIAYKQLSRVNLFNFKELPQ